MLEYGCEADQLCWVTLEDADDTSKQAGERSSVGSGYSCAGLQHGAQSRHVPTRRTRLRAELSTLIPHIVTRIPRKLSTIPRIDTSLRGRVLCQQLYTLHTSLQH